MGVINIRVDDGLLESIERNSEEGNRSEFIRDAIEEKLGRKRISDNEDLEILKYFQKMEPDLFLKKFADAELMSQTIYEMLKKQNEVLKLILRRASAAQLLSYTDVEYTDPKEAKAVFDKAVEAAAQECTILDK